MGTKNNNLARAKAAKNDEFYTQLSDIENELSHYKEHFRGKVIFCNCDDPYESNFFKYFAMNFRELGIKKLISTSYATSKIAFNQLQFDGRDIDIITKKKPYKIELERVEDINGDGAIDLEDVELMLKKEPPKVLEGDGDFRSEECVELLKQADIVVSNPPFSLFREYIGQLMEYNKKFVIIGNKNCITYKEVFTLIKDNKLWVGNTSMSKDLLFDIPKKYADELLKDEKKGSSYRIVDGIVKGRSASIWLTNLDIGKRHEELILYKSYNANDYPKYDNYNAINVDKVAEIPCDYKGIMGVPITFMDKYCPEQFEIIGLIATAGCPYIKGKKLYARVLIASKT